MPGKTGDSDLEAEEFGMVRGFMTAAHHRKASERWMMVLQGFIRHTTALGRATNPPSCEFKTDFHCRWFSPASGLRSRMTEGAGPVRSVTLKLSPKLSVSSSTLNWYLHRTSLQMPVHPGPPRSHVHRPRRCAQTSRSKLTPAPLPTPPGTASTGRPASLSRLASPSSTIASE